MGWNTASDGSGVAYPVSSTYYIDASLTLYAEWNERPDVDAGADLIVTRDVRYLNPKPRIPFHGTMPPI